MRNVRKGYAELSPTAVHRTIGALRQAESRYRRLFETARDGILLINSSTAQIEDVNPYLVEMLGYSHDEFLGKKLWEIGAFQDAAKSREMFEEVQANGYVRYDDLPLQRKSGGTVPVEFISNSYDCDGIKVIQCNIRDISQRKLLIARARKLANLYAALSASNRSVVNCADAGILCDEVCRAAVQFTDVRFAWVGRFEPGAGTLLPIGAFGPVDAISAAVKVSEEIRSGWADSPVMKALFAGESYWTQDIQADSFMRQWGDLAAVHGCAAFASIPLYLNGALEGVVLLYSDNASTFDDDSRELFTEMAIDLGFGLDNIRREQVRAREAERLIASEDRFRTLVEQSVNGIYIIQHGKPTYANPRCAELVGLDSSIDLIGADGLRWVAEADRDKICAWLQRLLDGGETTAVAEFDLLHVDGSEIRVIAQAACSNYEDTRAIIGSILDISHRKRAERATEKYIAQLKGAIMSTVSVAMTIGEMRDPYTAGHERRVAAIALAIAVEMGLDTHVQEGLSIAGHLHDIGKVIIPSEILSRPGKLSSIEKELIKGHCRAGYDVLKAVDFPWPVADAVLQHHERLDGTGYPCGLKGDAISIEAKIIAVADVVEAMSSHRPYRPAIGLEAALAEIERGSGTAFAAGVVDACLRLFREKDFQLPA
jgi:PAS domain S-box-containing protein/putative nucleotidyltransferase with HDIG domain